MTTLVMPIAGKARRFNGGCKPLFTIGDTTFIQAAVEPLLVYGIVNRVVFVGTLEQEYEYDLTATLQNLFPELKIEVVLLEADTLGPAATVGAGIDLLQIEGPILVCGCDESVSIKDMVSLIDKNCYDVIVAAWPDAVEDDPVRWAYMSVGEDQQVIAVADRKFPAGYSKDCVVGLIGCYYFADALELSAIICESNASEFTSVFQFMLDDTTQKWSIRAVQIKHAIFFGDPERLNNITGNWQRKKTYFVDLDGTVIKHEGVPLYDRPLEKLPGAEEWLNEKRRDGDQIVFTTARHSKDFDLLQDALIEASLFDASKDKLVTGISNGLRIAVNDIRPQNPVQRAASYIEVPRDAGFCLVSEEVMPHIIEIKSGGSGARTLICGSENSRYVRKEAPTKHAENLRNQARTLRRWSNWLPHNVPYVLADGMGPSGNYWYSMQHVPGIPLSELGADQLRIACKAIDLIINNVHYPNQLAKSSPYTLQNYVYNSVQKRLRTLAKIPDIAPFFDQSCTLNGRPIFEIEAICDAAAQLDIFRPSCITQVHGDLMYENILVSGNDLMFIDMNSHDELQPCELDLGKLLHSVSCGYEYWAHEAQQDVSFDPITKNYTVNSLNLVFTAETQGIIDTWAHNYNESIDAIRLKGYFHAACHFVRMAPYRLELFGWKGALQSLAMASWCLEIVEKE